MKQEASQPPTNRLSPPSMTTLAFIMSLAVLSIGIFIPSLPGMATYFQVDYSLMQLAISGYLIASAPIQMVAGPLSDYFGRRKIMIMICPIFIFATLGCLLSTNFYVFMFFRIIQSTIVVGAVLMRSVVRDIAEGGKAASMIAKITIAMSAIQMLGPLAGGYLDENFGWQASLVLLLAIGVGMTLIIFLDMGETAPMSEAKLTTRIKEYPLLLKSTTFWSYSAISTFTSASFFLFLSGGPLLGTIVFGLSPLEYSLYFTLTPFGYLIGNFLSGILAEKLGVLRMISLGVMVSLISLLLLLSVEYAGWHAPTIFFGFMAFVGVSNGIILPSASIGLLSIHPNLVGSAAGLGSAIITAGGAAISTLSTFAIYQGSGTIPFIYLMLSVFVLAAFASAYIHWKIKIINK